MTFLFRISVLWLLSGMVFAQQITLRDAAQKAVLANPEVLAKWHALRATSQEREVAFGGFLPRVDIQASSGRERKKSPGLDEQNYSRGGTTLSLNQMLYDGFATRSEVRRLGHARATRYFELIDASESTALEAARAYYDVLRYRRLVQLSEDNYVQHRAVFEQIQRRAQAGVGRKVDLEQAAGRLALAESNLLTETANLHDVSARYQRIIGEMPPSGMSVPERLDKDMPREAASALSRAQMRTPALLAAVENVRASLADVEVRRAAYHPRLDFRLRQGRDRNLDGVIGAHESRAAELVLNFNLFNGGSDAARVSQYAEQLNLARDLRDKVCRDTRQTIAIAYNDMKKLAEQLRYLDQHQLSIEKARDAYRKQFDIGQRTLLDLLDSENELFQAKRAFINAEHDLGIAHARTQAGMGSMLASLGLAHMETEEPAELKDWGAGEESAERCPAEAPLLQMADKSALDARALATLQASDAAPAAPRGNGDDSAKALNQAVKDWTAAWANKSFDEYIAFYAPAFVPAEGVKRETWVRQRKARLAKPGKITVKVEDIRVAVRSADRASTEFRQSYRSDDFVDETFKALEWIRIDGRWLILQETAVPTR